MKRLGVVLGPLDVDFVLLLAGVGLAAGLRHPLRRQGEEEAQGKETKLKGDEESLGFDPQLLPINFTIPEVGLRG